MPSVSDSNSTQLLKLDAQAFRGFNGKTHFDLSAPITIIYAPNGTGKTSFCQAAEWLLTGDVRNVEDNDLRCKQAKPELLTEVTGAVRVGEKMYPSLRHNFKSWILGDEERHSKILEALAPTILAERDMHHSIVIQRRREWLRGTHFLFTDSLAVLVDRGEETLAARRRIFADILGVRHLEEACEDLRRYSDRIQSSANDAERNLEQITTSLEVAEAQLAARHNDTDTNANVGGMLSEVEQLLSAKPPKASSEQSRLDALNGLSVEAANHLSGARERMAFVLAHWRGLAELESAIPSQREVRAKKVGVLEATRAEQTRLRGVADQADTQRKEFELRERAIENLIDRLTAVRGEVRDALGTSFSTTTVATIAKELSDELGISSRMRIGRRRKLEALNVSLGEIKTSYQSISPLVKETEELRQKVLTAVEMKQLRDELTNSSGQLSDAKRLYELASEPLQQMQEAAAELLDHLADGHECPVCSHDWKSNSALQAAMKQTIKRPLAAVRDMQLRIRQLEKSTAALRKRISDADELKKRFDAAAQLLRTAQSGVLAFESEFEELVGKTTPDQFDKVLEAALKRLNVAEVYSRAVEMFKEVSALVQIETGAGLALSRVFSTHLSALRAEADKTLGSIEVCQKNFGGAQKELKKTGDDIARLAADIQGLDQKLQSDMATIQNIRSNWQSLNPTEPLSETAINAARADLDRTANQLDSVRAKLEGAASILAARALKSERDRLISITSRMKARRDRLVSLVKKSNALGAKLDRYSRGLAWSKLEMLMPIAQTLFARMHANKVFDKVHPKSKDAPLDWLADAGDLKVNPQTVFSHGQRQDFALSLFLAKACVHGGTYILDEPIAHLDDLNRVAVLDVFRVLAITAQQNLKLVVTTSSRSLARHFQEKFSLLPGEKDAPYLKIIELDGNPMVGVTAI